jgi:hypothetical protein
VGHAGAGAQHIEGAVGPRRVELDSIDERRVDLEHPLEMPRRAVEQPDSQPAGARAGREGEHGAVRATKTPLRCADHLVDVFGAALEHVDAGAELVGRRLVTELDWRVSRRGRVQWCRRCHRRLR